MKFPSLWPRKKPPKARYMEAIASPEVLNQAWRCVKNDRGYWQQKIPMEQIQNDVVLHIGELSQQLLQGQYQPEPMSCYFVPKADGGERLISAAKIRDKLVQRAILIVLTPLGEAVFHRDSYGFRPQYTREMALCQIRHWVRQGWIWIADADIETCFDSILHRRALNALYKLCPDERVIRLVKLGIQSLPHRYRSQGANRGIPQGMVLSPFLCNVYLHALDCVLAQHDIPFVRFADDFVLLAQSEDEAYWALQIAAQQLHKLGLGLIRKKPKSSAHRRVIASSAIAFLKVPRTN